MRELEADHPASAGAPSSFDTFYATRWAPTVRLAHAVVGSRSVAEELTQDAFLRVHDKWATLDNSDAYLRTVLLNLTRTRLRRATLERTRFPASAPDVQPEPEFDETWQAVNRLPFRQRAVLALRYYADLPEAEIAELLGCRIGTVKSAHHRALAALRKELS